MLSHRSIAAPCRRSLQVAIAMGYYFSDYFESILSGSEWLFCGSISRDQCHCQSWWRADILPVKLNRSNLLKERFLRRRAASAFLYYHIRPVPPATAERLK